MSSQQLTPEVTWAQRSSKTDAEKNKIYLTIMVPDVAKDSLKLDLKPTSLTFTGYSETKKATYHVELEFYAEIDVDNSKTHHTPRGVDMVLRKKELKEEYWPRLLKTSQKMHFLKTDFDKWVDEDEQDGVQDDDYLGGMGGMGGMGGDFGGMGGMGGLDFSKLGEGAGMGDDDMEGLGGDEDDDEMPDLETEGATGTNAKDDGADAAVPPEKDSHATSGADVEQLPEASGETGASTTKTATKIEELS